MKNMNFEDGLKEIKIGQEVVYSNGQGGSHYRLITSKVKSIGNKYVELENKDKFYLDTGLKKTEYASGRLFSCLYEYEKNVHESKTIQDVEQYFRNYNNITFEQAVKIKEILGIK